MKKTLIYITTLSLLLLLGLAACQETAPPATETPTAADAPETAVNGPDIAFTLRHDGAPNVNVKDYVGILSGRNGCIHVEIPDASDLNAPTSSYLAVLPPDYSLERRDQFIVMLDGNGSPVGTIGDFIWVAGEIIEETTDQIEAQLPPYCSGPYIYIISASSEVPF